MIHTRFDENSHIGGPPSAITMCFFYFFEQLPLDLSTLTEAERKARVDKRKPRQVIRVMEELEDNFDSDKYLKFIRK